MIDSIYFAGPDVFRQDLGAWRARTIALCARNGVTPLLPCDAEGTSPNEIRLGNLSRLAAASAVIANLTPFRGTEVDTGTAFEVGYAYALKKPMVGYMEDVRPVELRVEQRFGPLVKSECGVFVHRDRDGFGVEAFGLPTNLMIATSIPIVAGDEEAARVALLAQGA